jgi:hypothetical protein
MLGLTRVCRSTFLPSPAFFFAVRLTPAVLELDALVINIELTLTSIIQGVALYFLSDNARSLLSTHDPARWLYVAAGLLIILIFWSRSILHTLTLIRWPLEFGHNFLYITCALGEALLFCCLTNPLAWFGLSTLYAIVVWFLFIYDLRMISPREADRPRVASRRICAVIVHDQHLNIRLLMPALFVFNLFCLLCTRWYPGFFLARQGHAYLIGAQIAGLAFYLCYVIRFFGRVAPLIRERQEERRLLAAQHELEDKARATARLRQV